MLLILSLIHQCWWTISCREGGLLSLIVLHRLIYVILPMLGNLVQISNTLAYQVMKGDKSKAGARDNERLSFLLALSSLLIVASRALCGLSLSPSLSLFLFFFCLIVYFPPSFPPLSCYLLFFLCNFGRVGQWPRNKYLILSFSPLILSLSLLS